MCFNGRIRKERRKSAPDFSRVAGCAGQSKGKCYATRRYNRVCNLWVDDSKMGLVKCLPRQQDKCRERYVQAVINAPQCTIYILYRPTYIVLSYNKLKSLNRLILKFYKNFIFKSYSK